MPYMKTGTFPLSNRLSVHYQLFKYKYEIKRKNIPRLNNPVAIYIFYFVYFCKIFNKSVHIIHVYMVHFEKFFLRKMDENVKNQLE